MHGTNPAISLAMCSQLIFGHLRKRDVDPKDLSEFDHSDRSTFPLPTSKKSTCLGVIILQSHLRYHTRFQAFFFLNKKKVDNTVQCK